MTDFNEQMLDHIKLALMRGATIKATDPAKPLFTAGLGHGWINDNLTIAYPPAKEKTA